MTFLEKLKLVKSHPSTNGHSNSVEKITHIHDNLPVPVTYITPAHTYGYINKCYANWFGLSTHQVTGKTVAAILGRVAYKKIKPWIEKALKGESVTYEEEILIRGEKKWIEAIYTPDFDAEGKVMGFIGVIKDITEKKRVGKELIRKKEQLEDYVSNASIGLHWVNANGMIIWANKAEMDLLGYTEEEYIGHHISEFHASKEAINDILHRLKCNETLHQYEAVLICKDGSIKNVLISSNVYQEKGKFIHTRCFTVDITERKKLEEIIQQNEQQYRDIFQQAPVNFTIYSGPEFIIEFANQQSLQMAGTTLDQVLHKPLFELFPELIDQGYKNILTEIYVNGIEFSDNERLIHYHKDGKMTYGWFNMMLRPLRNPNEKITGIIAMSVNITEQVLSRKKIEESEQKYRNLVHGLHVPIYTTDKNGYVTLYNESAAELWGRHPEIGKDLWCGSYKIFYTDGETPMPLELCPMAVCLKEKRKVTGAEIIIETPDKKRKLVQPHPEPIFDSGGEMIGAVNMLFDITDKKNYEENLARLAAIVSSSDDAIISKTLEGIITSWNPAAEKLFGYSTTEIIGQSIMKIIPPHKKEEEASILKCLQRGEKIEQFETQRIRKDGELVEISTSISPIKNTNGNVIGVSTIAHDITKEKWLNKELLENEERMRMASESTNLGTWEFNPLTQELIWSEQCLKIYGLPPGHFPEYGEMRKQNHPDDQDFIEKEMTKIMNPDNKSDFNIQYRIYRKSDNEMRWLKVLGKAFFNEERQPVRFIGTMLDITDEKIKEEQLKENIELFRTMADNVPAMIWMSGTDKFEDYFNETWLNFRGRTLQQESNEGWLEGVHPDDRQKCIDTYRQSFHKQAGFYSEYRILRHDGEYRWIADNSVPRFDTNNEFLGFISACIDIDDQKRFREKIQDSELLFKTISNASPAALWMTDTEGNNVFVNETWIKWTGIPFEQQLTEGWYKSLHPDDQQPALNKFMTCNKRREYYNTEFRFIRKDGEVRWGLTEGYPYNDINGQFAGYAGSVTDITELKMMEQRKDDFIKMASHELKTPITSINGYVQLLLNIYNEADYQKLKQSRSTVKTSLSTVAKQVAKLTRLISELLDLSKIESGKLELVKTEFELNDLVEETVLDIRHTTNRHAVILQSDFHGTINGDKDRLGQVITNLLNNAIKYSPDANQVEVTLSRKDNFATLSIKDQGIGIDEKDQQKIFDRFYRAGGKDELTFPGFGIGLFIASEIVHRHNGNITVNSKKGNGAEFVVSLPL